MKFLGIVLLAVLASIAYGVLHDQITVRICLEYFTVGHFTPPDLRDPTLIALFWGVVATWWVGAGLGFLLACAARLGGRPKLGPLQLVLPIAWTVLASGASAVLGGLVGRWAAVQGLIQVAEGLIERVPESERVDFLTSQWAHNGSYLGGILMGLTVALRTWRRRGRLRGGGRGHL